ncbi:MAG: DUF2007-related protein [Bacteroides sp.]
MTTKKEDSLVKVFGGTPWEAELVKGLLESNEILSMLKDDTLSSVTSPYAGFGGVMEVLVNEDDYELAKKILDERDAKG